MATSGQTEPFVTANAVWIVRIGFPYRLHEFFRHHELEYAKWVKRTREESTEVELLLVKKSDIWKTTACLATTNEVSDNGATHLWSTGTR